MIFPISLAITIPTLLPLVPPNLALIRRVMQAVLKNIAANTFIILLRVSSVSVG